MPQVTVLMSTYNRENYICEAIESILAQTFQDFEFLIINDGSVDRSREIILSYQDPRIRLVENEQNIGIPRSLNKGLSLAQGELIARLDSDDLSEPERLARQVAFLEAHPEIAMVGSAYQEVDQEGNLLETYRLPCDATGIRWGLLFYTPFLSSSVMFRRAILQTVGLYNENFPYAQDHELWVRIAKSSPVANLDESLVKYRVHPSSVTLFHETRQYDLLFQSCSSYMTTLFEQNQGVIDKNLFRSMQFLLNYAQDQDWKKFDSRRLEEAIQAIFKLSDAFCNYYYLDHSTCKEHRSAVINTISNKLLNLASDYVYQDRNIAWKLLFHAYLSHRSTLLRRRYQTALLKLLIGPALLNWMRQFTAFSNERQYYKKQEQAK